MTDSEKERVAALVQNAGALFAAEPDEKVRKAGLQSVVGSYWGSMPPWENALPAAQIQEVEKVTVGAGSVPVFRDDEDGRWKILLLQAGPNYPKAAVTELFTIPGGFINLRKTPGSLLVPASDLPEDPFIGSARETEEELQSDTGPLIAVDPTRLQPMDTKTLVFPWGEKRLVVGMMWQLARDQVTTAKKHIEQLTHDPIYAAASAERTINKNSGRAEIVGARIFDLEDAAEGRVAPLLHEDQRSLFKVVHRNLNASVTAGP